MKTLRREAAQCPIICCMLLLLPASARAWEPNSRDLDAAIKAGDFKECSANLSTWLSQKVPADPGRISKAAMKALLEDQAFMPALIQRQFMAKVWDEPDLGAWAKLDQKNSEFLAWLMRDSETMDMMLLARTPSAMFARDDDSWSINAGVLNIWKSIYYAPPESRKGLYLRLAIATALRPPGTGNQGAGNAKEPGTPLARYEHFLKAHKDKELFPSFDSLSAWELTHVVSSGASNADLAWGREAINTWNPGFRKGENVVSDGEPGLVPGFAGSVQ